MKKRFTLGIFLAIILGIGSNVEAATFTSRLSSLAGVPTARGYNVGLWGARATWYDLTGVTDTTALALPTYNDDVIISATDSIATTAVTYCKSISVSGTFYNGATFSVNGDITVNAGGVFNVHSNMYAYNVYNYGKFWNPSQGYGGSPKTFYLGCGFTYNGTTYSNVYGNGSYVFQNDGVVGGSKSLALAGKAGSGIYIYYSNLASSVTIQSSSPSVTHTEFTVGALAPYNTAQTSSQDFTLNINQSIALLRYSTVLCFSLQNSDAFSGKRTCNIAAGDTLYIGGYFHTKGSAPSVAQGAMTYTINGCLDFTSAATASTINEMDLYTSTSSPSITVNVNDGGTLLFGKAVKLIASAAGQTIDIKPSSGAFVKFGLPTGFAVATPITLTNASFPISLNNVSMLNTKGVSMTLSGAAAQTIDGGNGTLSALTISSTGGVSLSSPLTVAGALGLSGSNLKLGNNNLTVGSITSSSATSYIVTDGTGKLSTTAKSTGTLFPIGTASAYTPMTITPTADVVMAASVSGTATGTFSGYGINPTEWTITPAAATTAALSLTPSAATYTDSPVIFSGAGYAAKTDATVATGVYTASSVALDAAATLLATGGVSTPTSVETSDANSLLVYGANKAVVLKNAKAGDVVTVYGVNGAKIASSVMTSTGTAMPVSAGIYLVKVGASITKVAVF